MLAGVRELWHLEQRQLAYSWLQVFVSYGTQSNDSLLQYYAFSESDNPADAYVMTGLLQRLEELQPVARSRLDRLNAEKLLPALQEAKVVRAGFTPETLQVGAEGGIEWHSTKRLILYEVRYCNWIKIGMGCSRVKWRRVLLVGFLLVGPGIK